MVSPQGIAYIFTRDVDGDLVIQKANGAGQDTRSILLSIREGGYGAGAVLKKDRVEMPAEHWSHFEWFDDRDGEYYRLPFELVLNAADNGTQIAPPDPLPVRHTAWPGISPREAAIQVEARMRRRIEAKIKSMQARKQYEEEQAKIREESERLMREAAANGPSEEEMLERMASAQLGPNWRDYL